MSDEPKLSETQFSKLKAVVKDVVEKQREQSEQLQRQSRMMRAFKGADDITKRYPVAAYVVGLAIVIGAVFLLDGVKMWTLVAVGVAIPPHLRQNIVGFVTGIIPPIVQLLTRKSDRTP